jgi:flagellar hook-basal body complex protein FliE
MDISRIQNATARATDAISQGKSANATSPSNKVGVPFSEVMGNAIEGVNAMQLDADQKSADLIAGKTDDVHDVTISMQRAKLSFELMMEIRNKLLDTYKEVSRIQM